MFWENLSTTLTYAKHLEFWNSKKIRNLPKTFLKQWEFRICGFLHFLIAFYVFFGVYWYSELSPANGILNWYIDIGMDEKNTLLRVIPSTLTYYFNILSSILWHSFWHCVWQSLWHVFGSRRGWPTASGAGDVEFRSRRGRPTASRDRHMARRRRRTRTKKENEDRKKRSRTFVTI